METWQSIDSIRVVREFADSALEERDLMRIVDAGRRAGSSKNLQRWGFILVEDRARLQELSKAGPFAQHVAGARAAIALVTPDPREEGQPMSVIWDCGRAAQNMVLTAWELGIGSAPATVYEHDFVKGLLAIPADHHCEYILSFGYPVDTTTLTAPKQRGGRRPRSDVLHRERWGS